MRNQFPLSLVLCAAALLFSGCDTAPDGPTPTHTTAPTQSFGVPTPDPTEPPTAVITPYTFPPTVTAPPSACESAPRPTRLVVGERGVVSEENTEEIDSLVNVRSGPGTGNRVVEQMDIGDVFLVLDGPECSSQYAWYEVRFGDVTGWIAEGDTDAYYVAPFLPQ